MNPRLAALAIAAVALAGCAEHPYHLTALPTSGTTAPTTTALPAAEQIARVPSSGFQGPTISTFCDHGNRIYTFTGPELAGITAIPDPTCPAGRP